LNQESRPAAHLQSLMYDPVMSCIEDLS
jgi:hypothetical protein